MKGLSDKMILETERLYLREMTEADFAPLCRMLQDKEVMHAYEHAFDEQEARDWLKKQLDNYEKNGFGLWAMVLKKTKEMIGQCGLTLQNCDGETVLEIGYLLQKAFWHLGYATEAARACKDYAFKTLHAMEVYSIIRENNTASRNVAKRNGMSVCGQFTKHYYGVDMPHIVYRAKNEIGLDEQ